MKIGKLKKRPPMTRAQADLALRTAVVLIVLSLTIAGARMLLFGTKILPEKESQLWNLETKISITGGDGEGKATVFVPGDEPGQGIIEERVMSLGHQYLLKSAGLNRTIEIAAGPGENLKSYYRATIKVGAKSPVPAGAEDGSRWLRQGGDLGIEEGGILKSISDGLQGAPGTEEAALAVFEYIRENFETGEEQAADGDQAEQGLKEARVLFHLDLARSKGLPSRRVTGFIAAKEGKAEPVVWVEHLIDRKWYMAVPELGRFGVVDEDVIVLSHDDPAKAVSRGLKKLGVTYRLWRDLYGHHEVQTDWTAGLTGLLSLERLPVETQKFIKVLLLAPLAALLVVIAKTIIGIETVGTFLPVILALAWRNTELLPGIGMLTTVLLIGMAALVLFRRMGLPRVPSTALMVAVVVLTLAYFSLAGELLDIYRLGNIAFFPIIIMTLLVERISNRFIDDGLTGMLKIYGGTVLVASTAYLVLTVSYLQNLLLRFPELTLGVMGLIILSTLAAGWMKKRKKKPDVPSTLGRLE